MNTKTLSNHALSVIDQYEHFRAGNAESSVPYFNNKKSRARAALRAFIGKGSPKEIFEEVQTLAIKSRISLGDASFTNESLKKILADNNLGIDCSGFAYYILNAENQEKRAGSLDKHLSFVDCGGLFGRIRCALRPVENCSVATFASDKNSKIISIKDLQPGDMITMTGGPEGSERDHILIIYQIEYQNFVPYQIHYVHAVAYPYDGIYGTGIKKGMINIAFPDRPITDAEWIEGDKKGQNNLIFLRALNSKTELRRLNWW